MGCDIYGWVEVNTWPKVEFWEPIINCDFLRRNYNMFAYLFGVRNYMNINPIAKERGLPENVSEEYADRFKDNPDIHSTSWISLEELNKIDWNNIEGEEGEKLDLISDLSWRVFFDLIKILGEKYGVDNVRMVVGFDN